MENDEIELSIEQESNTSLPRRGNMESIFTKNMWPVYLCITRNMGQDGGHDKKLRNKMTSDNARNSIGI
jgi:hypothetical protein